MRSFVTIESFNILRNKIIQNTNEKTPKKIASQTSFINARPPFAAIYK